MRDDDDMLVWEEDLPPVIPPGEYDLICLSGKQVVRFKHYVIEFRFRIVTHGPYLNVELPGYCNVGVKPTARLRPRSKLGSWIRLIAAFSGESPSRVPLRAFRSYWFQGQVETVTKDHQQRARHPRDQYSKVADLLTIVGLVTQRSMPVVAADDDEARVR
jgi:hypothetical protein